ncbi:MAG TPA: HAD hydrolase-like protein [Ignavibacteria bacterium]|nr:HAD hydrolase-like protein [Ignavibacteria bacterium]
MKLIIFDIDGTLCHSRYIDDKCYIQAFKRTLDIDVSNTDWNSYKHVTDLYVTKQIIFEQTGKEAETAVIEKIINYYAEELKNQISKEESLFISIPGVRELFTYLIKESSEYQVAIATGGFLRTAMYKLSRIGISLPQENIYTSNNYDTKHEMISHFVNKQTTISRNIEKVIYVGDREYDYKVSKELKIDFIGIDFRKNDKLKLAGIEKVVNDYEPIEKFLSLV